MKIFKYFSYKEIKDICYKLNNNNCYYRHPQQNFVDTLGQDVVDKLVKMKYLKHSPSTKSWWDYTNDCYEYSNKFRRLFDFIVTPFWLWFKIYVMHIYTFKRMWQKLMIKFGKHYDWQDYQGYDIETY